MRYIVDANNYVKAISFGSTMEYNDCVCVEYTGMIPPGWNSLEDWYFDEGNKLWRWQIIDGELTMDETAVAPEEGSWMGVAVSEPVFVTTPSGADSTSITFDLPGGTKNLRGFFVLLNDYTSCEYDNTPYCVSLRASVDDNVIDAVYTYTSRIIETASASGCFELSENSVEVNVYGVKSKNDGGGFFRKNAEYVLYPFYGRIGGGSVDTEAKYLDVSYNAITQNLSITDTAGDIVGYDTSTGNLSISDSISYDSESKNLVIGG